MSSESLLNNRVVVLGAGAVGGYYGGMLARAGQPVCLVGRAAHVDAIRARGLRLQTQTFDEHLRVQASTDAAAVAGAALVLVCVKSTDTLDAAAQMAPHLAPDAVVLSLQNGVDNAERLSQALGRAVLPAVVYVAAAMEGPGHVRHHGRGELVIGPGPQAAALQALFARAGVEVQVSGQVTSALWAKLVLNCVYNALSAITQMPYGRLVQGEAVPAVMRDAFDECVAVATADHVSLPPTLWDDVLRIATTMPAQTSSTAQDLARGRRTEIDHLNGHIVRRGEALGIATPVNRALFALVRALESRQAATA